MKFSDFSIRAKLAVGAGALFAASMAFMVVGGIALMYNTAGQEAHQRAVALLSSYGELVTGEINAVITTALTAGQAVEGYVSEGSFDRAALTRLGISALDSQPHLTGLGIAFEPNALEGADAPFIGTPNADPTGRYIPYFVKNPSGTISELLDMSPGGGAAAWYDNPVAADKDGLTPPYPYAVNGKTTLLTTVSSVIHRDGKPIGALVTDLSLATIDEMISKLKPFGVGKVSLVSQNDMWIANADPALIGTTAAPDIVAALKDVAQMGQGLTFNDAAGVPQMAMAITLDFAGVDDTWTIVMEVPMAEIFAGVDSMRNTAILASLGTLAVVVLLVWFGAGLLAKPIKRITAIMHDLREGKFDTVVPYQTGKDEIGNMARAVEVFRENGLKISQMTEAEAARIIEDEHARRAMMTDLQAAFGEVVDAAISGDFTKRVHTQFPDAELNSLGRSVNALVETVDNGLSETAIVLGALARTDLTVRMQGNFTGSFAKLRDDANAVADTLSDVVGQLKQTSRSIKTATGEILSGANDLSERTTKQAATIEETSAAIEQLAQTVSHNADRARDANEDAQMVSRTAEEGGAVMSRATLAMGQISASSGKISNIIGLIDDIAFQTNLLALNASVEAARAGDAGKGFAVVAVEVRRLAQSAAQASSDVKALIETSAGEVTAGTRLVEEAADKLASMVKAARSNSVLMDGIARDSREQASAIDEVTIAVRQMDEMTQHNAALVEETNAAIEQTDGQVNELDRIVAVFHTDDRSAGPSQKAPQPKRPAPRAATTQKPASAYLSHGNAAVSTDWDEF